MPKDDRLYITVHNAMPDHPKVEALSDAAFRVLMRVWCRSSLFTTDGLISESWWLKQKASVRRELMTIQPGYEHALVEAALVGGGVVVHDYDEHQLTSADIAMRKSAKSSAGTIGNHERHHVNKGVTNPKCAMCIAGGSHE